MTPFRLLCATLIACAMLPAFAARDQVVIYRCTDARGKVELRDSPCPKGVRQTTRTMVRPVDAPTLIRAAPASPAPMPSSIPPVHVVMVQPPRPLYTCTTPDGRQYTSDSAEGNPRWVPLWALDYPVLVQGTRHVPGGGSIRYRDGQVDLRYRAGGVQHDVVPTIAAYGAGTWVRDACHPLPQQEACAQLRDQRDVLRRRAFNAQPSERARLDVEQRGINARLATDCGSR